MFKMFCSVLFMLFLLKEPSILIAEEIAKYDMLIPSHAETVMPTAPFSVDPIRSYDINNDGQQELFMNYKVKDEEGITYYGTVIAQMKKGGLEKVWEMETRGVGLEYSDFVDVTGDGLKEYLFGVTIGASAGHELQIYTCRDGTLQNNANIPYHYLEILHNKPDKLAVWSRFLADTYIVDVLNRFEQLQERIK